MQAKTKLSTEVENLVTTIVEAALALAALVARQGELEQRFEFAWGHQSVISRTPAASHLTPPTGLGLVKSLKCTSAAF